MDLEERKELIRQLHARLTSINDELTAVVDLVSTALDVVSYPEDVANPDIHPSLAIDLESKPWQGLLAEDDSKWGESQYRPDGAKVLRRQDATLGALVSVLGDSVLSETELRNVMEEIFNGMAPKATKSGSFVLHETKQSAYVGSPCVISTSFSASYTARSADVNDIKNAFKTSVKHVADNRGLELGITWTSPYVAPTPTPLETTAREARALYFQ